MGQALRLLHRPRVEERCMGRVSCYVYRREVRPSLSLTPSSTDACVGVSGDSCGGNRNWDQDVICRANNGHYNKERFKRQQFKGCKSEEQITSVEECSVAGQAVGGWLGTSRSDDWGTKSVAVRESHDHPCGCYVAPNGRLHFGQVSVRESCMQEALAT